jgi:hypothetical protein
MFLIVSLWLNFPAGDSPHEILAGPMYVNLSLDVFLF